MVESDQLLWQKRIDAKGETKLRIPVDAIQFLGQG